MNYSVGQVIYVVLKKEIRIYPMLISEQITRKTLEGEVVTYTVRGGSDPQTQMLISEVDGEIFDSAEKARTALIDRAKVQISKMVDNAVNKAKEWYPSSVVSQPSVDPMSLIKKQVDNESLGIMGEDDEEPTMIELPDGRMAKVRSVKVAQPK